MRFESKSALVTGAGMGIGAATASRLASEGARVLCVDCDETAVAATVEAIGRDGGTAVACHADVSRPEEVERAVAQAIAAFGGLHLAVNNAGIGGASRPLAEQELSDWDAVMSINLGGVFYGLKYEIPAILGSGGGAIVNVSSMFGKHALRGRGPYTAAKFGVIGLSRAAAADYADKPIRINTVCPGVIDTPLVRSDATESEGVAAMVPMGRMGAAGEVAATICFLLSDDASYVTASEYDVDGGILH
jgi:NAD(P)-dependent dehydrogenase (short-subunit alcohol dehydrogenase family)